MRNRLATAAASIGLLVASACTTSSAPTASTAEPTSSGTDTETATASPEPVTTLAGGQPLPEGCPGGIKDSQTVAFHAEGRVWSLNPETGVVACLIEISDPGPFRWGPLGDRVVLGDAQVLGVNDVVPATTLKAEPAAMDWGHPVGIAIVYAGESEGVPFKHYLEESRTAKLSDLPRAGYRQLIYHPSGLALAFILDDKDGTSIWISTNEGADPHRLVFSRSGAVFTSIAFSPDGRYLSWTADHGQFAAIHTMDLTDRTTFTDDWREEGLQAAGLAISPTGDGLAMTTGGDCASHEARVVTGENDSLTFDSEGRPSEVRGWLDPSTLLVGVGGCGEQLDLYTWTVGDEDPEATLVVSGVTAGASRAKAPPGPDFVPAPPEAQEPDEGVG
jgi:hypothetical protein